MWSRPASGESRSESRFPAAADDALFHESLALWTSGELQRWSEAGYLSLPEGGSGPGVVVIQEIFGVNDVMRGMLHKVRHLVRVEEVK